MMCMIRKEMLSEERGRATLYNKILDKALSFHVHNVHNTIHIIEN